MAFANTAGGGGSGIDLGSVIGPMTSAYMDSDTGGWQQLLAEAIMGGKGGGMGGQPQVYQPQPQPAPMGGGQFYQGVPQQPIVVIQPGGGGGGKGGMSNLLGGEDQSELGSTMSGAAQGTAMFGWPWGTAGGTAFGFGQGQGWW